MKRPLRIFLCIFLCIIFNNTYSQTSWTGLVNTNWNNAGNWTAGIPTSTTNVTLGDAGFTGINQPTVNVSSACNTITIGGAKATTFTLSKNLVVNGSIIINSNGSISHAGTTITVKGNWTNNGTYTATKNTSLVVFGGLAQLISGTAVTSFRRVTVNAGALLTLGTNVNAGGTSSYFYIYGTLDPGQSPTYTVTSSVQSTVFNNGKIKVNAATFAGNYIFTGTTTLSSGSMVDYSSTVVNQTVSNVYTYSTLIVSGSGVKTLGGNLPFLNSAAAAQGNIYVNSGTLDLLSFTANRNTTTTGGAFILSGGAFLNIGGASNYPANFNTNTLALSSTVEYNGIAQNVVAQTYGNLIFSSGSGASVKTLPAANFTIQGNFSSVIGLGTSVSYTAASNIVFNGNVSLGSATTFNGGNFSHTVAGNWVNSGTFSGSTGTITFNGPSTSISGAGAHNFNNLSITAPGITAASGTLLNVSGNLTTSGAGQFTHLTGGSITMTGAAKSISGLNMVLYDLTVTGTVTTNTSFTLNSNLVVSGSFSAGAGTVLMNGSLKTISGAGTIVFSSLQAAGSISTASGFSVSVLLDVSGSFSASAGTATFTGTSLLSGIAGLYNVTINGTSLQLAATAVLGIANIFTITAGVLNVTSTVPNTVNFNGTVAQSVNAITYNNLILSNGNTKTAAGNISVNAAINISNATTFAGGSFTHMVLGNWLNNGSFTAGTSTIQFTGANNATVTGATTFNILTLNKSTAATTLTLLSNITVPTVNMTAGKILTGTNSITITSTRTGNGIILGTITRTHLFMPVTSYAFEGPNNTINFLTAVGVSSVTVTVTSAGITDFPNNASVNREYNIAVTGTSYNATLRLHYEDAELNGNNESNMGLWNYPSAWTAAGKSANDAVNNYVELSGISNLVSRWTCSEIPGVVSWNGSASNDWSTAANWTNVSGTGSLPPGPTDIVQIGTTAFTNDPIISTAVNIKGINFGSVKAAILTLATGGSLTTSGNIGGTWSADAVHTINASSQNITVNGSLTLSNGITNRSINLNISSGTITVLGSCIQKGNAAVNFSSIGSLNIGLDFIYTSGVFIPGIGTVTYNGNTQQAVALVSYNNLTVNTSIGKASIPSGSTVSLSGNLSILSGQLEIINSAITVNGNTTINAGALLNCDGVTINAGGNWTNNGTYSSTTGTVNINGSGTQNISAGAFNNLTINKPAGTANLTGNNTLAGNLSVSAGTLNLSGFTLNRQTAGGSFSMAAGASLLVSGANNFPGNYSTYALNAASTVNFDGTMAQSVAAVGYGNLSFTNGGLSAKNQLGDLNIAGDILINGSATFNSAGFTSTLGGNWTNNGTYTASTGTVILNGPSKSITGNTTFNSLITNGSYTVLSGTMVFNGLFWVTTGASYVSSSATTFNGDLTNNGSLVGNGITTFTGTSVQTIRLVNALTSASNGVVNFNGNISPILNSNTAPSFATLNINNTAGVNPSVGSSVFVALNIGPGAKLNIANLVYNVYGSFTNAGTVTCKGTMNFLPAAAQTIALGSTGFSNDGIINFGGAGQMTITGTPDSLNTVMITNTNPAGITPSSNWRVDSNFVVAANALFNAGSYTYTVGGNIVSNGTLTGGTSTFIINSPTGELSVGNQAVFNHFTNNGMLTPQTDFNVAGNFTNNGTYDGSIGELIMTGNNAASIAGTTTPSTIAQLTIQKTGGAIVTQNVSMSNLGFLNIFSGTLFTSTYTITQDATGGILMINDSATLKIGGTNTLPAFSGYGLGIASNVDYAGAGTTQSVANAAIYGNLIISGAGSKNAYTNLTVLGNLTINAGTLYTNTFTVTHTIGGDFTMTGGTITGTNSTYVLNGTVDQSITLLSNLVKLTLNKSSGIVNPGADITVNNILNFTAGKIKTGNYKVIIPTGGTVTGAAQGTGWVNGNLQKNVALGASVSRSFEIGDSTYYSPATILFSSVTTAGNLIAKATAADQPQVDYSGIDSTKSVNRFYTISNAGIGFTTATATFNWSSSDLDAGTTTANFKTALFDGSNWTLPAIASPLANSIQATGLGSFGDFAVGERVSLYKWTGENFTSDCNTAKNWSGGLPTNLLDILIPTGINGGRYYPVLNTGSLAFKNLNIAPGAFFTVTGATLKIAGTLTGNNNLIAIKGAIEMNGTASQTIPANCFQSNAVKDLVINNTSVAGVDLGGALNIYGSFTYSGAGKNLSTNDVLTLKSSASNTARLGDMTGNTLAGKVSVERYINVGIGHAKSWQFLAVPATGQTINAAWQQGGVAGSNTKPGYGTQITNPLGTAAGYDAASPGTSIKTYVSATNTWDAGPSNTANLIDNKNGYMLFVRGDRSLAPTFSGSGTSPAILSAKGTLFTPANPPATINVNAGKYEAVGNPYASQIDFTQLSRAGGIDNLFYAWDPALSGSYGVGGYQTISATNGWLPVPGSGAYTGVHKTIESGQAFFVHATALAGTIGFSENAKTTSSVLVNFQQNAVGDFTTRQYLRTTLLTNTGLVADGNAAAFDNDLSNVVDGDDALKILNGGENFGLVREGKNLAVEARSFINSTDTLFYNMSRLRQQDYRLMFVPQNMDNRNLALLQDRFLQTQTAISLTDTTLVNITVNSNVASAAADRFIVIFQPINILPVKILSITAARNPDKTILINWRTANEINLANYLVERSSDGINFTVVNTQNPKKNNAETSYIFTDLASSNADNFYRIKASDLDGKVVYSTIVKVPAIKLPASIAVYPNPVIDKKMNFQFTNELPGNYQVEMTNNLGQVVYHKLLSLISANTVSMVVLPSYISSGTYQVSIISPDKIKTQLRVFIK